jgi:hypothetical protein
MGLKVREELAKQREERERVNPNDEVELIAGLCLFVGFLAGAACDVFVLFMMPEYHLDVLV